MVRDSFRFLQKFHSVFLTVWIQTLYKDIFCFIVIVLVKWLFIFFVMDSKARALTFHLHYFFCLQVMDIKRLNNMMSDHGIYSRERLLIPISSPELLIDGTCYIEFDTYAKREAAVLYLEGAPEKKPSCLLNRVTSVHGRRRIINSLRRSMQVDDETAQYYLSISNGNPRAALSEFSADLEWERQGALAWRELTKVLLGIQFLNLLSSQGSLYLNSIIS